MSMITPEEGWDAIPVKKFCAYCGKEAGNQGFCTACGVIQLEAPDRSQQLVPWGSKPSYQQPYVQQVQPQITQQVTIVQAGPQVHGFGGLGCLLVLALLVFPLWPITIPILVIWAIIWGIISLCTPSSPITYRVNQ